MGASLRNPWDAAAHGKSLNRSLVENLGPPTSSIMISGRCAATRSSLGRCALIMDWGNTPALWPSILKPSQVIDRSRRRSSRPGQGKSTIGTPARWWNAPRTSAPHAGGTVSIPCAVLCNSGRRGLVGGHQVRGGPGKRSSRQPTTSSPYHGPRRRKSDIDVTIGNHRVQSLSQQTISTQLRDLDRCGDERGVSPGATWVPFGTAWTNPNMDLDLTDPLPISGYQQTVLDTVIHRAWPSRRDLEIDQGDGHSSDEGLDRNH